MAPVAEWVLSRTGSAEGAMSRLTVHTIFTSAGAHRAVQRQHLRRRDQQRAAAGHQGQPPAKHASYHALIPLLSYPCFKQGAPPKSHVKFLALIQLELYTIAFYCGSRKCHGQCPVAPSPYVYPPPYVRSPPHIRFWNAIEKCCSKVLFAFCMASRTCNNPRP